jgi:hypothetical protein
MKKFLSTLLMIIIHLLLTCLNFYFIKTKGIDMFQSCSFFILHAMWQHFYIREIKSRIYGLK